MTYFVIENRAAFQSFLQKSRYKISPFNNITAKKHFLLLLAYSGLPDGNKKLSPNSLKKIAKLSKNSPNFLKWLHHYQNMNFFTENQSLKALLLFPLNFTRNRTGFQHFANISK